MAFYPLGLLLITFDDEISQGFVDRLVASICGSLSLSLLNQNIFCSCPFGLDVGYFFCSLSLLLYYHLFPRDSPTNTPQRHRNVERARECQGRILESPEHRRIPQSSAVGGSVPFILPFPIAPPVAPLQIPPAPEGDNLFVGVLYNARKNETWE